MPDGPSYQRARRPEQKAERRTAIVAAARAEANGRGVRGVSLGDIAKAADMAKSNVLRYFGTREEIYLHILSEELGAWLDALEPQARAAAGEGAQRAARLIARSLVDRPLLCDLLSEMAVALERNVRAEFGRDWKIDFFAGVGRLGSAVGVVADGIEGRAVFDAAIGTFLLVPGVWATFLTPQSILDLLEPAVIDLVPATFEDRLERLLRPLYTGLQRDGAG